MQKTAKAHNLTLVHKNRQKTPKKTIKTPTTLAQNAVFPPKSLFFNQKNELFRKKSSEKAKKAAEIQLFSDHTMIIAQNTRTFPLLSPLFRLVQRKLRIFHQKTTIPRTLITFFPGSTCILVIICRFIVNFPPFTAIFLPFYAEFLKKRSLKRVHFPFLVVYFIFLACICIYF